LAAALVAAHVAPFAPVVAAAAAAIAAAALAAAALSVAAANTASLQTCCWSFCCHSLVHPPQIAIATQTEQEAGRKKCAWSRTAKAREKQQ